MFHHPVLFGILFGLLVTRLFARVRRFRRHQYAGAYAHWARHAHGCGGGFGPRFFRFEEFDAEPRWRRYRGDAGAGNNGASAPVAPQAAAIDPERLERALTELELSERQREEIAPVFTRLGETVGGNAGSWAGLGAVFAAIAAPEFDKAAATGALSHVSGALRQEILDGLEHAHNVLTAEQRDKLQSLAR